MIVLVSLIVYIAMGTSCNVIITSSIAENIMERHSGQKSGRAVYASILDLPTSILDPHTTTLDLLTSDLLTSILDLLSSILTLYDLRPSIF